MKVKLLVGLSGPTLTYDPGDDYECSDAEAARLIDAGFAVPLAAPKIERAVKAPVRETRKG